MKIVNKIFLALTLLLSTSFAEEVINNETTIEETTVGNDNITTEEKIISTEEMAEESEPVKVIESVKIKDVREINKANVVVIQALNKITAKSYKYNVKVGDKIKFERLTVKPLFCWKSSPDAVPENKVLMKISENKLNKTTEEIFYGWMFSSSPGISSLEHPMYDITIVDCLKIEEQPETPEILKTETKAN